MRRYTTYLKGAAFAAMLAAIAGAIGIATGGPASAAATAAPTNDTLPTIAGVPEEGETLTGEPGKWSGTDPITFNGQWRRCNSAGAGCVNIPGATSQTYRLRAEDVARTIR